MNAELPHAPYRLPLVGHMAALMAGAPWDVTERWLRERGPTVRMEIPGAHYIVTADPELIRHVIVGAADRYVKDLRGMREFLDLLGHGLLTSDGELWRRQRAVLTKAFRIEALRNVAEASMRAVDRLSLVLDAYARSAEVVDMGAQFRRLTLQVIAEATLQMPPHESDDVLPRLYEPLVEEANKRVWQPFRAYLPTPAKFRYDRSLASLNATLVAKVRARLRARRANPEAKAADMLDMLIASLAESGWDEAAERLVCDELRTMLFAGHDTSSAMLTWTLHALTRHPAALERLRAEAAEVFGGGGMPDYEQLKRLDFAGACLKEALRLYNIVPIVVREARVDDQFGALKIARGTKVMVHMQALHKDPKVWPEPDAFRPERFLGDEPIGHRWLPFITGPRSCVGQHFSLLEAKIVLSRLLLGYEFSPAPENSDARHRFNVPVGPRAGIRMRVRPRA
ncbi:MAG TPA: cytochrome P450 [Nannocystis sp.]